MAAKRGNGEGSIFERKDGRYAASITTGYVDGKASRKTVYGRTRAEVAERLNKLLTDRYAGLPPADDRLTVGKYMTEWLASSAAPKVRASTLASYSVYVHQHIVPGLGKTKLAKLTPQMVDAFLAAELRSGLSARTVNHIRAVLRTALNRALAWGQVPRNAAALATAPRVVRKETPVLTPQQAGAFVAGVADDRLGPLYITALTTGLRLGEACGLSWADVDLAAGTLRVRQALQRTKGAFVFVEPKSTTSRRTIAIPEVTLGYLRQRHARQRADKLAAGREWTNPDDLVFTTELGQPLNPSSTTRHLREVLARLGLPTMRFHDLRHACASLLLAKGVHPRLVMETLGHSQISLTMNTYSHVIPQLQREVANQMDSVFTAAV